MQLAEAFAGLGFFLVGLSMLSDVVRTLAARRMRQSLLRLGEIPLANVVAGSVLGMVTQSSNAATYVCIGLLNSRAIKLGPALAISAWAGVGTSLLVFLASIDLRLVALLAISTVALLYMASLHRKGPGRPTTELLMAIGITLLGLAMIKNFGHALEQDPLVRAFFAFSSDSWIYAFLIGLAATLLMHSSSTVAIVAVALSTADLVPLADAIVLVCGSNLGSGLSVAVASSHLRGSARHLGAWQAVVKGLGAFAVLIPALGLSAAGAFDSEAARAFSVPTSIATTFLVLNASGAAMAGTFQSTLLGLLERIAPLDRDAQKYELQHIIDESADDPETALMLARQEQARLIGLLPEILAPLRPGEEAAVTAIGNAERRQLGTELAERITDFVSEAVSRHPDAPDTAGMLLVQRCNHQTRSLLHALHDLVDELGHLEGLSSREQSTCSAMTESIHLLLTLAADHASGDDSVGAILRDMTSDRSEVMSRFRNELVAQTASSGSSRESMFVATTLFERIVWLIAQVSGDLAEIAKVTGAAADATVS